MKSPVEPKTAPAQPVEITVKFPEQIAWKHESRSGQTSKKSERQYVMTNRRCYIYDEVAKKVIGQAPLDELDVIVMNSRKAPGSSSQTILAVEKDAKFRVSRGDPFRNIGDLYFLLDGKVYMVFPATSEPDTVKGLFQTLKKQFKINLQQETDEFVRTIERVRELAMQKCGLQEREMRFEAVVEDKRFAIRFSLREATGNRISCVSECIETSLPEMSDWLKVVMQDFMTSMKISA